MPLDHSETVVQRLVGLSKICCSVQNRARRKSGGMLNSHTARSTMAAKKTGAFRSPSTSVSSRKPNHSATDRLLLLLLRWIVCDDWATTDPMWRSRLGIRYPSLVAPLPVVEIVLDSRFAAVGGAKADATRLETIAIARTGWNLMFDSTGRLRPVDERYSQKIFHSHGTSKIRWKT
jgi:hypothetical protein